MEEVVSSDLKQNPKRFYSYIKSKRQESEGVSSLIDKNGFLQSDSTKRAEVLNDQFVSAYTKDDTERLPSKGPSPFSAMRKIIVSPNGVTKLLRDLKPHKASGPDSIPTYILKVAADEISPVLTKIFQTSLDTGEVPADWRKANIVPLFKKGDKHQASNYRPVSLTSVTCKVLEHIVHSNVINHFLHQDILCDNQHGFRSKRSCETQLITTLQNITSQLRTGRDQVDVILLDFSKAFDKVPHRRLLHKLDFYGVRGDTLRWIKSFLSYRKQQVLLEGAMSAEADVISWVPQGTVLGPLLFLAFINNLPDATSSDTRLFADDALIYRHIKSDEDARRLHQDLDALQKWESEWQMNFHPEKCQVIRICTNKRFRRETTYTLHGHILEAVESAKYLGVTIGEDLQWKTHIDNITAKASRTVGFLRRNLYNCTKEVREATYCSIVRPTLDYASSVWDPYRTTDINRVEQVQRRAARFVHRNYWDRTPGCVSRMVRELGWPPLVDRRREHRLTMLYKIQRGLVDINPGPILRTNDRRTREGNRIYQPAAP